MLQIRNRPYNLLLLTGLIFFLTSFLVINRSNSVDIHLHDTYFIIAHTHIFWLLAVLAIIVWTIYLLTNKVLYSKALTWTHVIITILTLILLASTLFFGDNFLSPTPRRYYNFSDWKNDSYSKWMNTIAISIFILLLGQIIFIVNFIAGIFKRRT